MNEKEIADKPTETPQKHPDESGGFHLEAHIKIFDPESQEIFVDKRS
jgi:hypothetical protein